MSSRAFEFFVSTHIGILLSKVEIAELSARIHKALNTKCIGSDLAPKAFAARFTPEAITKTELFDFIELLRTTGLITYYHNKGRNCSAFEGRA